MSPLLIAVFQTDSEGLYDHFPAFRVAAAWIPHREGDFDNRPRWRLLPTVGLVVGITALIDFVAVIDCVIVGVRDQRMGAVDQFIEIDKAVCIRVTVGALETCAIAWIEAVVKTFGNL